MKLKHILLSFISIVLFTSVSVAQETTNDSIPKQEDAYGLRVGADLSKPLRTLLEDGYSGFEIVGDFRISERFYAAAEIGNEKKERFESNLNSIASGSYVKIGADFNAYNNWLGMENAIYGGLRYGFSTFSQELLAYGIYTTNQTFPGTFRVDPREYTGLTASWLELQVGVKTEILNNLYLTINLQLKRKISETTPDNFDNLFIPGFNRTYDFSEFGAGYGYSISYLIPIFKK
ncbi:MAG: hypothetical protein KJO05_10105 [Bacteroidia bacterium]|nr:hypothetical protein [Bacteroidia bacterium]NNF29902.1 hypothetical protein [Flavobacteriaceae bacterium]MBT8276886.1 hypothetical protein [Bacteroidia bacterium]NNJ81616.1 hypothetical protein [Flavobacteriaceae bacterium]NNK55040.1 hypothetical protein [Flavobacteriaceae bacterium]